VRAEADADVEGLIKMERDGRAELVQRFAFDADQEGDRVAALLDSDAPGLDVSERAAEAVLGILHLLASRGSHEDLTSGWRGLPHSQGPSIPLQIRTRTVGG
jgi:hypothetical protein